MEDLPRDPAPPRGPIRPTGLTNLAAVASGVAAVALARLGEFAAAGAAIERCRSLAAESRDPNAILDAAIYAGLVETERGRPALTVELTRPGVERADELGNYACSLVGNFSIGRALVSLGQIDRATEAFERSRELATFCQVGPIANLSRAWLSALRAREGDGRHGLAGLDEALREARRLHDRYGEADILRERAAVLAGSPGEGPERALADLREAIAILERIEAVPALVPVLRQYAAVLAAAGDASAAAEAASRAAALEAALIAGAATRGRGSDAVAPGPDVLPPLGQPPA